MPSPFRSTGRDTDAFGLIAAATGILFGTIARAVQMVTTLDGALAIGAAFGVGAGLASYRKWHPVAWDATTQDWELFKNRLTAVMLEGNFEVKSDTGDLIVFDRLGISDVSLASIAKLSPGTLYRTSALRHGTEVVVTGPEETVAKIRDRIIPPG